MQNPTGLCEECNAPLPARTSRRGRPRRFCPGSTCQVKAWKRANPKRHVDARAAIVARESEATAAAKGTCEQCGEKLPLGQKFLCGSPSCKQKHRNAKQRQMRAAYRVKHGRSYRAATHAKCVRKRKAIKRKAEWEDFEDREIFERDGWICQIGLHPVDPEVKHPAPGSATIDHHLPLSYGGGHTRRNVRLACNKHNVARGNKVSDKDLVQLGLRREDLVLIA